MRLPPDARGPMRPHRARTPARAIAARAVGARVVAARVITVRVVVTSSALVLALLGCARDPEATSPVTDTLSTSQQSWGLRVRETELGRTKWELEAEEARQHEDPPHTELHGVTVRFFDSDGELSSTLTADEGEVTGPTRRLVARSNVVVITPDGERLETEVLEWNERDRLIRSDAAVRIVQGRNLYTGVGLVSDPELDSFEILEDFEGTVIEDDDALDGAPDRDTDPDGTGGVGVPE